MFFCKQKTAYAMRISDWSSHGFSSDRPNRRIGRKAEVIEVAFVSRQLKRLATHIQEQYLFARVANIVFADIFGNLPRHGGRGALNDAAGAVGNRRLDFVRCSGRTALLEIGRASCRESVCE